MLELRRHGPRRSADHLEALHDGLVVAVLEADPQPLARDRRCVQGLGLVRAEGGRVGRHGAAAGDEGEEARPLQGEEERQVRGVPRGAGEAEVRLGGVLQVGGEVG